MEGQELKFAYILYRLDFVKLEPNDVNCAMFTGKVNDEQSEYHFRQYLSLLDNGEWKLERLDWNRKPPVFFDSIEFIQQLINKSGPILYPINMWSEEQTGQGAGLMMNQKLAPVDRQDRVVVSFRSLALHMPSPPWDDLWILIENRLKHDKHFNVQGFSNEEIITAIEQLKLIFPASYVKKQFKLEAESKNIDYTMGMDFPPESEFWYPAYHLGRTALGAICIDPGWNFLIELGLSMVNLKDVAGIDKIKNSLTKYSGNQHCICLANDLHNRGLLSELEPQIQKGSYKNDISITYSESIIDIESKAFTSNNPDKALIKEINKKIEDLPQDYNRPLIFYAVLIEKGKFERDREQIFFNAISNLPNDLSEKITAVVGGKLFVDSSGGRLKRDAERIFINPNSKHALKESDLEEIFVKNYEEVTYPIYGPGTFFYFK